MVLYIADIYFCFVICLESTKILIRYCWKYDDITIIRRKRKNTRYQELLLKIILLLVCIYLTWFSTYPFSVSAETHINWIGLLIYARPF